MKIDWGNALGLLYFGSSSHSGVRSIKFFEKIRCMQVLVINPRVVGVWVAFPMDEVLKFTSSSVTSGIQNVLDLVLLFTIDDWRWACKRHAILFYLLIWKE